jgi:high-affinity iron transporter
MEFASNASKIAIFRRNVKMGASFLIMLRETLEAALIIGIMLGSLAKLRAELLSRYIWLGAGTAVAASLITAYLFERFTGGFDGPAEQIFEGSLMLLAVIILTGMIIWMKNQGKQVANGVEVQLASSGKRNQRLGLAILAFIAVYREGVESILFLKAAVFSGGGQGELIGAISGLLAAVILALVIFKSSTRLSLTKFFKYTGVLLLVMAAGLLSNGIHEFQEVGWVPMIIEHLWNLNSFISGEGALGSFLKALFGYNPDPSLVEAIAWLAYILVFLPRLFKER